MAQMLLPARAPSPRLHLSPGPAAALEGSTTTDLELQGVPPRPGCQRLSGRIAVAPGDPVGRSLLSHGQQRDGKNWHFENPIVIWDAQNATMKGLFCFACFFLPFTP